LEDNNHGDIVKTEVSVAFSKGELPKARELLKELQFNFNATLDRSVHHMTLAKFGRELKGSGQLLPSVFTVHSGQKVEVVGAEKRKK
jgi:hypothetical protein